MRLPATLLFLSLATAAPAVAEQASFSVSVTGIPAGSLALRGSESGNRYKVQGQVRSSGIARGLYPAEVTAAASGQVRGNSYSPSSYSEESSVRGTTKTKRITYSGGVPNVTSVPADTRRKPYHAAPRRQGGTVDPLTIAYAILRDRPAGLACNLDLQPYDGRERTRIRMSGGTREGDTLVCPGIYTRVAGFSEDDMRKADWPFTVTYEVAPDGTHRVEKVHVPTSMGPVVLRRR